MRENHRERSCQHYAENYHRSYLGCLNNPVDFFKRLVGTAHCVKASLCSAAGI
jgi:hypothetical protein